MSYQKERGDWIKLEADRLEKDGKVRIYNEAVIISSTGSMFHADVLEKVKNDSDLKDMRRDVRKIRRRHLMVELKRSSESQAEGFSSQVKNLFSMVTMIHEDGAENVTRTTGSMMKKRISTSGR